MGELLLSVGKTLLWSFLAKPILMRAAFGLLALAASRTDNKLDDKIVTEAKARYYNKTESSENSEQIQ